MAPRTSKRLQERAADNHRRALRGQTLRQIPIIRALRVAGGAAGGRGCRGPDRALLLHHRPLPRHALQRQKEGLNPQLRTTRRLQQNYHSLFTSSTRNPKHCSMCVHSSLGPEKGVTPETLIPEAETLAPVGEILNQQPQTRYPKPKPPSPKHQTPNTKPETTHLPHQPWLRQR